MRQLIGVLFVIAVSVGLVGGLAVRNELIQSRKRTEFFLRYQIAVVNNMVLSHSGADYDISGLSASVLNQRSSLGPVDLRAAGSKTTLDPELMDDGVLDPPISGTPIVAHRVGDYVFTYHGIDLATALPRLWLVVQSHDPRSNKSCWPLGTVHVGQADGLVRSFPVEALSSKLNQQNELRIQLGLPPLPDPCTVWHEISTRPSP